MPTQILKKTVEEYRWLPAIANSDLSIFEVSPSWYKEVKDGVAEGFTSSGFKLGTLLDIRVMSPEEFDTLYIVQPPFKGPSSPQQEKFVELVIAGEDVTEAWSQCYSTKGKKPEQIAAAAEALKEELKDYLDFFLDVNGREIVPQEMMDKAILMESNLRNHPVGRLLFDEPNDETVFNQLMLQWTSIIAVEDEETDIGYKEVEIDLKGMLDKVHVDLENKRIIIRDLKTTAKDWKTFRTKAIPEYGYGRQGAMYVDAAWAFIHSFVPDEERWGWTVIFELVVAQSFGRFEVKVFRFDNEFLDLTWDETVAPLLSNIYWHMTTGKWEMSRHEYDNNGVEVYYGEA